jgi:hypothetical protein
VPLRPHRRTLAAGLCRRSGRAGGIGAGRCRNQACHYERGTNRDQRSHRALSAEGSVANQNGETRLKIP